jgi:hypothetical protein
MALKFLNTCRSFDPEKRSLSFWGHDNMFEVAFTLDQPALHRLSGLDEVGEAAASGVFDRHRTQIWNAARRVYKKTSKRFCPISAADL